MAAGASGAVASGVAQPLMTLVFGEVVDAFGSGSRHDVLHRVSAVCLKFFYLAVGSWLACFLQVACWMITGERQAARIRGLYLEAILRQDFVFFDKEITTGQLVERMSGDTILIQDAIGEKVGKFIQLTATFIGGFVVAFSKGWLLAAAMLSSIPPIVIAGAAMSWTVSKLSSQGQAKYNEAGNVIEQTIGAIRTVASFNGENRAIALYNKYIRNAYVSALQEGTATGLGFGFLMFILFCSYGLTAWYGAKLIVDKGYEGGQVVSVWMAFMTGAMSLGEATPCVTAFASGRAAGYRMMQIIQRKPEIDPNEIDGVVLENIKGDIELRNVYFSYPSRPGQLIFDGFSLHVLCGKTIAIVGESGSGKSTVINLVERFYDPQAGEVLIDGVNIKSLRLGWLRGKMGLVSQEPLLFATNIRENINYGKEDATDEEIMAATKLANAANFIDKLPNGLDTMVGEHGAQLSGGQKQRIAIARAVLREPRILLLDEATSALDAESERAVQEALDRAAAGRTTVVVAHRLSTIRDADVIAVLRDGEVVAQGTHEQLMASRDGPYASLVELRMRSERAGVSSSNLALSRSGDMAAEESTATAAVDAGKPGKGSEEEETMAKVPFHGLFMYADRTDAVLMLAGMVGALGNGMSMVVITVIFGQMVNAFGAATPGNILHRVSKEALNFIYLAIGTGFASFVQVSCWTATGERQATRIRSLYLKSVLSQDMTFFDVETTTGQVVSSISADTTLIQGAIGEKIGRFLQLVTTFFGGFVLAFIKGWLLTLVMLSTIPPFVAAAGIVAKVLSKISNQGLASYSDAGDVVEQTIGSIRTVVSFNGEKKAIELYNNLIKKAYKGAVKAGAAHGFGMGLLALIYFSTFGLIIWYGSKLSLTKGYSGGDILNVMFAIMIGARSLGDATPCIASFEEGRVAAYRLFKTIKRRPEIDYEDSTGIVLEDIKGDVELKDVSFSYPGRPDQLIFNGFSLHVSCGTTMAIVGESGSGKSTVINLVERFYDPQVGEVLIDGMNIKSFRLDWIRGKIGLVNQEPLLFMTSIRENINYGKEDATFEEIKRAAELANAASFIENFPNGYDTTVGQRGAQLSGGQKQRIAIARAILKNPKILLLDEATSALDLESERIVQDALNRIMVGRTTLVVAHRLSTIRNAHCISVVSKGKLVEQGHHDELVKDPNGAYSQLIRMQETQQGNYRKSDARLSGSASKKSGSLRRSVSRSSGGSSRHSLSLPFGVPGPTELLEYTYADGARQNENTDGKAPNKAPMGRLISLNKPEAAVLLLGSIVAAIDGAIFPTLGLAMASAANIFYEPPDQQRKDSTFWASMCVVLGAIAMIAKLVNSFLFAIAGGKLIERIRALTFQSIVHQEVAWFDHPENSSGALNERLSTDALNVRRIVGDNLALLIQSTATLICGIVIAMVADWKLSLVILFVIPLVGLQGYAQVKFLQGFSQDAKTMYEEASQVATEAVGSIRTVASFCAEKRVMDKYNQKCQASRDQGIRTGIVGGLGFGFSYLMLYASSALCYYVGAKFVSQGKSTFGDVFKAYFALLLAMLGVSQTNAMASDSAKANDSATSIFSILDRKSQIDSSSEEGSTLANVKGDIDFKHVSFKYPSRPDVQIFTDFTLDIPSGKTVALVGQSGSGKSTVIALLERFYEPDSGAILLDKVEIGSLKISWLREQMGLVSQEPVLFSGTIRDNIAYGKHKEVTEEEIASAARAANAHEFISSMPQGYNTAVGERGAKLSGGQKQRIAIARAILKDPRILLLDEATSALDAESERVVQDALDRVMVGRTTIIVAHRISTIQGADMIAVLKDGVIVEKGRHETLIGVSGGAYASLVELRTM
ncbi:hypothetical protein HU200_019047 [Digitaria exilis]|uniref:Uncharacterized protein n=1 Tax=Digitaria exilis TaxID=1010633 RepID=A0A835F3W5_9POAL|nr:hypothetical protein HU200_019047 [Digitaria exilis]